MGHPVAEIEFPPADPAVTLPDWFDGVVGWVWVTVYVPAARLLNV